MRQGYDFNHPIRIVGFDWSDFVTENPKRLNILVPNICSFHPGLIRNWSGLALARTIRGSAEQTRANTKIYGKWF
jgi:hypothetical protein